jgi:outer membrane protein assembly factor BamB
VDMTGNVSPSAVAGLDTIYTFGGFPEAQTTAIRRGGRENVTNTHLRWKVRATSHVPTPLLLDNHLIWVSTKGQAFVLDATSGEVTERRRLENLKSGGRAVYASPVRAGKYVYVVTRRSGTFVFDAHAELSQVTQNPALDDSDFNATPAIADGQLFLRSDEALYCIE